MKNIFTQHPKSVNETYLQHMKFALLFGMTMIIGGIGCLIHAVLPFLFIQTGTNYLIKLIHYVMDRSTYIDKRFISLSQYIYKKCNRS
jgi:heme/copper-type cytochrome/quinol oxidase subunit 1